MIVKDIWGRYINVPVSVEQERAIYSKGFVKYGFYDMTREENKHVRGIESQGDN